MEPTIPDPNPEPAAEGRLASVGLRRATMFIVLALVAALIFAALVAFLASDPSETFAYEGFN